MNNAYGITITCVASDRLVVDENGMEFYECMSEEELERTLKEKDRDSLKNSLKNILSITCVKLVCIVLFICNATYAQENPYKDYKINHTYREFIDPIYWIYDFIYINPYTKNIDINSIDKQQEAKLLNSIQTQTMEQLLRCYPSSSRFVHSCIILGARDDMESKKQAMECSIKYWLKLTQNFLNIIKHNSNDTCKIYNKIFIDENNAFAETNLAGILGILTTYEEIREYDGFKISLRVLKAELEKTLKSFEINKCLERKN